MINLFKEMIFRLCHGYGKTYHYFLFLVSPGWLYCKAVLDIFVAFRRKLCAVIQVNDLLLLCQGL